MSIVKSFFGLLLLSTVLTCCSSTSSLDGKWVLVGKIEGGKGSHAMSLSGQVKSIRLVAEAGTATLDYVTVYSRTNSLKYLEGRDLTEGNAESIKVPGIFGSAERIEVVFKQRKLAGTIYRALTKQPKPVIRVEALQKM
jgi:hypothetical protein